MHLYFVTMSNGSELVIAADTPVAALVYAGRSNVTSKPVAAKEVR